WSGLWWCSGRGARATTRTRPSVRSPAICAASRARSARWTRPAAAAAAAARRRRSRAPTANRSRLPLPTRAEPLLRGRSPVADGGIAGEKTDQAAGEDDLQVVLAHRERDAGRQQRADEGPERDRPGHARDLP